MDCDVLLFAIKITINITLHSIPRRPRGIRRTCAKYASREQANDLAILVSSDQ